MLSNERANILITVLWVITILVVIVAGMSFEARSDVDRTILMRDRAKAYWMARGAVERVKFEYAQNKLADNTGFNQDNRYQFNFAEGNASCILLSNSSKASINTTDRIIWEKLFQFYGIEEGPALDEIVDAVLDWRDEDDSLRVNGAENDYYQSLEPPYLPRNGPFQSLEELLLVRGVTEAMFHGTFRDGVSKPGLKEMLNVSGPVSSRFDINSAPKGILMAFLEIDDQAAEDLIRAREEEPFQNPQQAGELLPIEAADKVDQFFISYRGNQFTVKATANVNFSTARYTVEDEVRFTGGGKLFIHLSHKDFSLEHVDELSATEEDEP